MIAFLLALLLPGLGLAQTYPAQPVGIALDWGGPSSDLRLTVAGLGRWTGGAGTLALSPAAGPVLVAVATAGDAAGAAHQVALLGCSRIWSLVHARAWGHRRQIAIFSGSGTLAACDLAITALATAGVVQEIEAAAVRLPAPPGAAVSVDTPEGSALALPGTWTLSALAVEGATADPIPAGERLALVGGGTNVRSLALASGPAAWTWTGTEAAALVGIAPP